MVVVWSPLNVETKLMGSTECWLCRVILLFLRANCNREATPCAWFPLHAAVSFSASPTKESHCGSQRRPVQTILSTQPSQTNLFIACRLRAFVNVTNQRNKTVVFKNI